MAKEQDLDFDEFDDFKEVEDNSEAVTEVTETEGDVVPNVPVEDAGDIKDVNELFHEEGDADADTKAAAKGGKKGAKKGETKAKEEPKVVEPPYTGIRHVTVYGKVLFTVDDPAVTNDDIRQRIYDEFQYHEFLKERTIFSQNRETGALELKVDREKRG